MTTFRLFVALVAVAPAAACVYLGEPGWDEVARAAAPGAPIDAVLIEINGGATVLVQRECDSVG